MNYRHAFHAGNFADVIKHIVLVLCIEHLKKKPAPFRVIDTHAGIGRYRLHTGEATRTGEWRDGIARLFGPEAAPLSPAIAALLKPYLDLISAENSSGALNIYPGSPAIVQALLRRDDRFIANELHPEDAKALAAAMKGDKAVITSAIDGYTALKAHLPPKERRGLVLVDPPFEEPGELIRLTEGLAEGLKRFATGTFALWYPIKDPKHTTRFKRAIAEVTAHADVPPALEVEMFLRPPRNPALLNGAGLVVINPPFTLYADMNAILTELLPRLSDNPEATFSVDALPKAPKAPKPADKK